MTTGATVENLVLCLIKVTCDAYMKRRTLLVGEIQNSTAGLDDGAMSFNVGQIVL